MLHHKRRRLIDPPLRAGRDLRASTSPSRAQVRANRRNAKRSTGPRSVEGKARSSLNAATHGMFCKSPVLPGERDSEYVAFRNLLLDSPGLRPQDWLELSLADQFVLAKWRIRRLGDVEAMTHQSIADDLAEVVAMRREDLGRVLEQREAYLAMRGVNDRVEDWEEEEVVDGSESEDEDKEDDQDCEQRLLRETFVRMNRELRVPASVTMDDQRDHQGRSRRRVRAHRSVEASA